MRGADNVQYHHLNQFIFINKIDDNRLIEYYPLFKYQSVLLIHKGHRFTDKAFMVPGDFLTENLITYPVDRNRLDVFQNFLSPASVEPAEVRTSELTSMIVQLVANKRGVAVLPSWAITKYVEDGTVISRKLNRNGLWGILYAAIRKEQSETPYMKAFLRAARKISAQNLDGIALNLKTGKT